jgi:hypothetical protein
MNWFQKLLNNPNVHIAAAMVSGAASIAFPAYALPLQALAGLFGTAGMALPEAPRATSMPAVVVPAAVAPVSTPVVLASGTSMHAADYAALLTNIVQMALQPQPKPAAPAAPANAEAPVIVAKQ